MSAPQWVRDLKPSGPQGSELLEAERAKSAVNVSSLSSFLFTNEGLARKHRVLKILQSEKVFDKSQNYFAGRIDRFETALARAKRLRQIAVKHGWTNDDRLAANDLISEPGPYGLHESMFLITLRDQGTPEQHEMFLKKAEQYKIIGCYAQTELGHGSNVRGLETTATWNPDDKTFTIHSPHLTASKWWIGSLGRTANYAVVMAQLIIGGKPYGPHPFVVHIRDHKTHEPLENIYVGDIGPKFGYNTMDNGYLLFNHVKVPHISMLAKFSSVDLKTNQYKRPASASLIYGTLTWVRSTIVMQSGGVLARGVTIATRYAAVRRQFQDRDAQEWERGENQVLNYTTVQIRLLPLLATTFALHFTGKAMMALYGANQKKMSQDVGKMGGPQRGPGPEETHSGSDLLADLHATSCGLKSLASYTAVEGLEVCRRACGGHGYSSFSGIGSWYADYLPTATWEGDNYMLTQQVARYLLKAARGVLAGSREPSNDTEYIPTTFLSRQDTGAAFDILGNDSDLVAAFAWRSAFLTFEALKHRDEQKKAWNDLLVDFYRLSRAHSQYMVVKNFYETLQSSDNGLDSETLAVMHKLFRLYALHTLESEASEFYTSAAVTVRQIQLARTTAVMKLLAEIRPHAVRLVDAWDFPDWQLDSSLGRFDGKVYEDMFYRASELNPLNRVTVDPYPDSGVLFKRNEAGPIKPKL
ncbi:hypothetical protein LTR91_000794 [Friedmanniomyces endolithicus]|uniref:Acyl-coenzyme A oxidase n=1 Tax=Friedmanniomyces endolithicus TaxID=329885 RepID=A0AAN6L1G5_9PEZI|nr:hypothetical protein LTR57_006072 [Friedmanniomyces endolithicus]KAK0961478.1 hypothetical protein LTS01_020322 [Friedmanniomyces endolithicus]KAK1014993.1 hypothetical protein LTR91_000794 [Friedmanniomyces endolithicus]KAK1031756.1 hypothetical protein LTS16_017772 [Friedmanniomyces endolithicus]